MEMLVIQLKLCSQFNVIVTQSEKKTRKKIPFPTERKKINYVLGLNIVFLLHKQSAMSWKIHFQIILNIRFLVFHTAPSTHTPFHISLRTRCVLVLSTTSMIEKKKKK